jgi:polysaccharide biosynthesis protein PslG
MTFKKCRADATGAVMIVVVITLLASGPRAYCQVPAAYFGMDLNERVVHQPPPEWGNPWPVVPIGSLRLWDSGVTWANINTAQGVYDWKLLDEWLQDVQTFNIQEVLYTFGATPQWASSNPNDPICPWGPGECDPPKDLKPDGSGPDQIWKDFLTAIAGHSAGRIKYWEVWDEPKNVYFWHGTVPQMVRMAKDAREVILSIDPHAIMLTPPSRGPWQLLYFAAGGAGYADIISYHGYAYTPGCVLYPRASDELLLTNSIREIMWIYGQSGKPVWDTETSWGRAVQTCFFDEDLQAAYLAQSFMLQWSAGVERVFWYMYNNQLWGTLWTPDPHHPNYPGTLHKAGVAYEQVYKWMVGMTLTGTCGVSGTTWTCNFVGSDGYLAEALWDTSETCNNGTCGTRKYNVSSKYISYLTLDGSRIKITNGKVLIGAKPIWVQNQ